MIFTAKFNDWRTCHMFRNCILGIYFYPHALSVMRVDKSVNFQSPDIDQSLWQGIRAGDREAFTLLFEKYNHTLYNYGSKLTRDSTIIEDAIQDIFIDLWRLRVNLAEQPTSVKFYLYRALRRRIHLGVEKFPFTDEISGFGDHLLPFTNANSEKIIIESEALAEMEGRVKKMLSTLPDRQIEAITLKYFDEFKTEEIAKIMGVSEKSVRNFIYRALNTLRQNDYALAGSSILGMLTLIYSISNQS